MLIPEEVQEELLNNLQQILTIAEQSIQYEYEGKEQKEIEKMYDILNKLNITQDRPFWDTEYFLLIYPKYSE